MGGIRLPPGDRVRPHNWMDSGQFASHIHSENVLDNVAGTFEKLVPNHGGHHDGVEIVQRPGL
jgi:hypothetical protein